MIEAAKPAESQPDERIMTHYDTRYPRLPWSKRVQKPIVVGTAIALQHLLGPTLRFDVFGYRHYESILSGGHRCIFAFWHETIFLCTWWWRKRGIVALTSGNFDGQLIARLLEGMGYETALGSSSRGGLRGIVTLAKRMKEGRDAAFAADGPRGPRHTAKPGTVLLARRTGNPILPLHIAAERRYTFKKSWDRFQLPYPFSRAVMFIAPPIVLPPSAGRDVFQRKQDEVQRSLEQVRNAAESWFTSSRHDQERQRAIWNA